MHRLYSEIDELTHPLQLAAHSGATDKQVDIAYKWYSELFYVVAFFRNSFSFVAALTFLFSVTYHVISKLRGNEKNI